MELVQGWGDFLDTSPAAGAMKKPDSGHAANRFGFHIDDCGLPIPFAEMPEDSYVESWRTEHGVDDYAPVVAVDVLPGHFAVSDLIASVHGVSMVDFQVGGKTSRGVFRVTADFMYGSAFVGLGAQWRDDAWVLGDMGGTARLFKWPLGDVASISVQRTHKMFKLRDEEIIIRGKTPPAGAKGLRAGVSVSDWLGGAQPEDVTEVTASSMRFGGLSLTDVPATPTDGSDFLGFAEYLAGPIAAAQGGAVRWDIDTSGKDKSHTATFG